MAADVDSAREKLIEAVVEIDDEIMTRYLDGGEITTEEIYKCLKESTLQGKLIPVLAGSGLTNNGALTLLDAIVDYLPSPAAAGPFKATNASGKEESVKPAADSPLTALVFKTTTDPHVGKVSFFRVYSGVFSSNSQVWNVNKGGGREGRTGLYARAARARKRSTRSARVTSAWWSSWPIRSPAIRWASRTCP